MFYICILLFYYHCYYCYTVCLYSLTIRESCNLKILYTCRKMSSPTKDLNAICEERNETRRQSAGSRRDQLTPVVETSNTYVHKIRRIYCLIEKEGLKKVPMGLLK